MTALEKKVFTSSNPMTVLLSCPPLCGHFSIQESAKGGLSYKAKKPVHPFSDARAVNLIFCFLLTQLRSPFLSRSLLQFRWLPQNRSLSRSQPQRRCHRRG